MSALFKKKVVKSNMKKEKKAIWSKRGQKKTVMHFFWYKGATFWLLVYSPGQYISEGISQQTMISWGGITQFGCAFNPIFMHFHSNYRDNVSDEGIM